MAIIDNWAQNDRVIHSIKTAFACFVGLFVGRYLHFQAAQWITITTLVVMCAQVNVGSMLQKSYMRFLGTCTGSLLAISTIAIFGDHVIAILVVIVFATILFSFIATSNKSYSESGTLGAVTVAIILLTPNPTIETGLERFIEISIGILIAALISQFILPIHAKTHLRRNQADTIKKIRMFYLNLFTNKPLPHDPGALRNLDEEIVKSLIMQRKLAGEARREKLGDKFKLDQFQQCLWCEKEVIRCIVFMFHAYQAVFNTRVITVNQLILQNFHHEACHSLLNIAVAIEAESSLDDIVLPTITSIKAALYADLSLSENEKIALNTLIFSMQTLIARLDELKKIFSNLEDVT